jgi:IclR family pca regulon transcriptional regulator
MGRLRAIDAEKRLERDRSPDFLEALARGISVLMAFDTERRQMTLSDVARVVDLPKATVRRAIFTLASLGFIEGEGRLFRLTPKVLTLATAYLNSNSLSRIVQAVCERVSAAVTQGCSAAVLDGTDVVMVAHAAPPRFVGAIPGIGFRLPAYSSSLGRVLLAALPEGALESYLAQLDPKPLTDFTVTGIGKLRDAIVKTRMEGFSFVEQEAEIGFRSVAVPLRRYDGKIVAALNLGARIELASVETMLGTYLPMLRAEAETLQQQTL